MITPKNDRLFLSAPFFLVRIPTLSKDDFFFLFQDLKTRLLPFYLNEPVLQEALLIASPSLSQALEGRGRLDEKKTKQITSSLLKYISRMATRATPFGLFSSVSIGSWGKTFGDLDLTKIRKRARPDMEWLFKISELIYSDNSISELILIKRHPLVFFSKDRIILNYRLKKDAEDNISSVSIGSSSLMDKIFEFTETPIPFVELNNKLMEYFPSLDKNKTINVIKTLIEQQFLCPALLQSLVTDQAFLDFLMNIPSICSILPDLQKISSLIQEYNTQLVGESGSLLKNLQEELGKIKPSNTPLQVDCVYSGNKITISPSIAKELEESAEILWRISSFSDFSFLKSYHQRFLEKYGINRLVPLLQLLDANEGLGIPNEYNPSYPYQNIDVNPKAWQWRQLLNNKLFSCIRDGKKEIILTEADLEGKIDFTKALPSIELYCEVLADSAENVDKGEFLLHLPFSGWQAGASFGRFADILENPSKKALESLLRKEEDLDINCLFADVSFFPSSPRLCNVTMHPRLRRYTMDIGFAKENNGTIKIQDVYVGAKFNRLYLTLKNINKELIITANNLLRSDLAPTPVRFLRDVSKMKYQMLYSFSWPALEEAVFLPRVKYKRSVFFAARWKLIPALEKINPKEKEDQIKLKFLDWAKKWEIPRYVYIYELDQGMLLDLTHAAHLNEICSQIKKGKTLILIEKLNQENGDWIKSQRGTHCCEFIFPLLKNPKYSLPEEIEFPQPDSEIKTEDRRKLPGSEWLYVKFYLEWKREDKFLANHLLQFIMPFIQNKVIKKWFFVRYNDENGDHLRVRFLLSEYLHTDFLSPFHKWTTSLFEKQVIHDLHFCTYEKEIERYGGINVIEEAENFFCADSNTALSFILASLYKKHTLPSYVIAALSIIELLKRFGLGINDQVSLFNNFNLDTTQLKGYRLWKSELLSLVSAIFDHSNPNSESLGPLEIILEACNQRLNAQRAYLEKIITLQKEQKLSASVEQIYDNLIHMHCNRVMGFNTKLEQKARLYAAASLNALLNKEKLPRENNAVLV